MPRSRRFFSETFKKEIVYKLNNHMTSNMEIENQYKIPKMLQKRWVERYGSIGEAPQNPVEIGSTITVMDRQLDSLVNALLAKKLAQLLTNYSPSENHVADSYKLHKVL